MLLKSFKVLLFWLIVISTPIAQAGVRFSAGLGLGSTTSKNEISKSEGPLAQNYNFEYLIHSHLLFGAEHMRSLKLSPLSTGISFSGLFMRYYLNAAPAPFRTNEEVLPSELVFRDISYFVGTGFGFAQASLPTDIEGFSANAAGFYLSPRAGMELQLTSRVGVRSELMTALMLMGKGSITMITWQGAIYYGF